jgi:tetratricopeptide (TPR) repeat protein
MPNPHLERAWMLLGQSRHELAEKELRQALAQQPDSSKCHVLLALCLAERDAYSEATQEAEQGIHLAPDDSFAHYVLSCVMSERNRNPEAEQAVLEAIRLDPYQPNYFAQLAQIHFSGKKWQDALDATEQGLRIDPEDGSCTNLRAMALVKLGRRAEAGEAMQGALARKPDDAVTHANQGWTLIEQGQHEKAMEHFREALRIDPTLEWARLGIVEALKARYFIYRIMLGYFLWMMKLGGQAKWGVILGGYIGFRVLTSIAGNNPNLAPWIAPILILYVVFAVMTWVASPLFNLLLRLNRFGRLALSREQTITSNWVGACVLGTLISLILLFGFGADGAMISAITCGLLIPPLSAIYHCSEGWPRTSMFWITVALAGVGLGSALLVSSSALVQGDLAQLLKGLGWALFLPFVLGSLASQFAANALVSAVPRK